MITQSAEREELRAVMRQLLSTHSTETHVRSHLDSTSGYDSASWRLMAEQVGVQALAIPEEFGGAGYGFGELSVVLEEAGRSLLCAPLLSTCVLATSALLIADDRAMSERYLPRIASGETVATMALLEDDGRLDPDVIRTEATVAGGDYTLTGRKTYVVDGADADFFVVVGSVDGRVTLFIVEAGGGVEIEELATLDQTRNLAHVTFTDAPAAALGEVGEGWRYTEGILDTAAAALAAEQVGAAAFVLDMTVEYVKTREQFGRPVGSFQAVKHKLADMLVELESAKSAAQYACAAVAENSSDRPLAASIAKAFCSEAYYHITAESIQLHGGIGFTWEHPAHLYFKRARGSQTLFGSPSHHRERIAELVGL